MTESQNRSGFVALIGRPNVGKSTLINAIVGQKIAIMSDKPQTTRTRIRGVLTRSRGQAVILDTPGLHEPKHRLGKAMVEATETAIREVDLLVYVTDASAPYEGGDEHAQSRVKNAGVPAILVLNKIDKVPKARLLEQIDVYRRRHPFVEIVPVSALTGEQVSVLETALFDHLPEGPQYYPGDVVTDHPERFIVAELIREKILQLTREEVPHSVAVAVEQMEYREDRDKLYVNAIIYTERESHKAILIGKSGDLLKRVGTMARRDIEGLFGSSCYLELWVKVKRDWRNSPPLLRSFGLDHD